MDSCPLVDCRTCLDVFSAAQLPSSVWSANTKPTLLAAHILVVIDEWGSTPRTMLLASSPSSYQAGRLRQIVGFILDITVLTEAVMLHLCAFASHPDPTPPQPPHSALPWNISRWFMSSSSHHVTTSDLIATPRTLDLEQLSLCEDVSH